MPEETPSTSAARPTPVTPPRHWTASVLKWLLLLLVAAIAVLAVYFAFALNFSYSTGERAGYVQKFSKKGWVCKTWEGELATVTLPGALPERFEFSVRDEAVAQQVSATLGGRVVLTYEEHVGLPSCFAETGNFVTGVRRAEGGDAPVPAPLSPSAPSAPAAPAPPPAQ